jgi:uncharacterized protein
MVLHHDGWREGRDYRVLDRPDGASLLFITGNHRMLEISPALGERLRAGPEALAPEERDEWNGLVEAGVISDVNARRLEESAFADGANLAVNINLTAFCNLGCTYCFADGGDYGRIKGKMEAETVDHLFTLIRERVTETQTVRFEFFGGEPLLNFALIEEICARGERMTEELGIRFNHRISSNLTVLPKGAPELFAARRFVVSVSLDGGKETHDRNRPTKGGRGSYDNIVGNCRKVREVGGDAVTLVARMTVTGGDPTMADNVRLLWDLNLFDYFQVYPAVVPAERNDIFTQIAPVGAAPAPKTTFTTPPTFLRELAEFVEIYPSLFTPDNRFRGLLEYERLVDMVLQGKMALSYCSAGRNYFTLSPDDSIMPCHRLVGETDFQVGSGPEGITASLEEWRLPVDNHPVCGECWIRYLCGGGCKQENYVATGRLNGPNPEMCRYQISLVENVVAMAASQGEAYRAASRGQLDDMFVSCGRPVVANLRAPHSEAPPGLRHFAPL